MRIIKCLLRCTSLTLLMCIEICASAQVVQEDSNGNAIRITNDRNEKIEIRVHFSGGGTKHIKLEKGQSADVKDSDWMRIINDDGTTGPYFWKKRKVAEKPIEDIIGQETRSIEDPKHEIRKAEGDNPENNQTDDVKRPEQKRDIVDVPVDLVGWRKKDVILLDFKAFLDDTGYYSSEEIILESNEIDKFIQALQAGADRKYVDSACPDTIVMAENLNGNRQNSDHLINQFLKRYRNSDQDKEELHNTMVNILNERLNDRETNLNKLKNAVIEWEKQQPKHNRPLIGLIAGIVAVLIGLISWLLRRKKKTDSLSMPTPIHNPRTQRQQARSGEIVVRRKTTSILKKQSLDNVIDNPCYLAINCADFCQTSAVRRIFIKNTCIKDIYNMYAEDLRNPDNPKEDGCMVLGRWVHDKDNNEYYVSLEEVVMPGDDAVFSEYELNFGGKIKLKVSEKLRKLRRETDLQYDMTCWVHSHPGLGVFFSNQDNTVHMQLKHPTHPHFLTAIVIDILTPEQELGIFTFKPDGTLNSKADLTQMYSLEDMYKWAIESERNSFKREDHFDTLAHAKQHENNCHGVHMSNSAIIDIDKLAVEHENGMADMVHGFIQQEGSCSEIAVSTVCHEERIPDNEPVGCFIITKYCSIPTVRKAIEQHVGKIRFALVYSTADGLLTTIPMRGRELITDETYYGEQKLEDLKIWTRRKR